MIVREKFSTHRLTWRERSNDSYGYLNRCRQGRASEREVAVIAFVERFHEHEPGPSQCCFHHRVRDAKPPLHVNSAAQQVMAGRHPTNPPVVLC
jgi:hypothetical protein